VGSISPGTAPPPAGPKATGEQWSSKMLPWEPCPDAASPTLLHPPDPSHWLPCHPVPAMVLLIQVLPEPGHVLPNCPFRSPLCLMGCSSPPQTTFPCEPLPGGKRRCSPAKGIILPSLPTPVQQENGPINCLLISAVFLAHYAPSCGSPWVLTGLGWSHSMEASGMTGAQLRNPLPAYS